MSSDFIKLTPLEQQEGSSIFFDVQMPIYLNVATIWRIEWYAVNTSDQDDNAPPRETSVIVWTTGGIQHFLESQDEVMQLIKQATKGETNA